MRRVSILLGLSTALLFGSGSLALAGSFSDVPAGDPAYQAACRLIERGLASDRRGLSGPNPQVLTRYEFALLLDEAIRATSRQNLSWMTRRQLASTAADLSALASEFADVIPVVQLSPGAVQRAIASLRRAAAPRLADLGRSLASSERRGLHVTPGPISEVVVAKGSARLGVGYGLLASALSDSPSSGPRDGLGTAGRLALATPLRAARRMGSTESDLQSLRGRLEYGVTRSLSLGIGYQMLQHERTLPGDADVATLKTLAMGYRMSSTTTVSLRYHLIDYADKASASTRSEERLTEAEIAIRF